MSNLVKIELNNTDKLQLSAPECIAFGPVDLWLSRARIQSGVVFYGQQIVLPNGYALSLSHDPVRLVRDDCLHRNKPLVEVLVAEIDLGGKIKLCKTDPDKGLPYQITLNEHSFYEGGYQSPEELMGLIKTISAWPDSANKNQLKQESGWRPCVEQYGDTQVDFWLAVNEVSLKAKADLVKHNIFLTSSKMIEPLKTARITCAGEPSRGTRNVLRPFFNWTRRNPG